MKYPLTTFITTVEFSVLVCCLISILIAVTGGRPEATQGPSLEPIPAKQVQVEGVNIRYIDEGEGDPLVLVHGIPTSSFLWRHMIKDLSAYGRVIAPDLPGFGFSDPPQNGDYSISNYARLLESFLETLSLEPATLICHDYGGPIVITYAMKNPDKYKKLIILDTFLHDDLPPMPLSMKIDKVWPFGEIFMGLGGESIARTGLEDGVVDKALITEEIVKRYYLPQGTPEKLNKAMLGTLRAEYKKDLALIEKNIGNIEKPTLIIWGDKDRFLPLYLGQRIQQDIRGSKLEVIPNCGHFLQEEKPETVTKIIVEFLGSKEPG